MGITLPFAQIYMTRPNMLHEVGVEGTKGLVELSQYGTNDPMFKTPEQVKYYKIWNKLWKTKWQAPYNTHLYEHGGGNVSRLDPADLLANKRYGESAEHRPGKNYKGIGGDSYQYLNGKIIKMRPCDHKAIPHLAIYDMPHPSIRSGL